MAKFEILIGSHEQDQDKVTMALHENFSNIRYVSVNLSDLSDFWPEGETFGNAMSTLLEVYDAGNKTPDSFMLHPI